MVMGCPEVSISFDTTVELCAELEQPKRWLNLLHRKTPCVVKWGESSAVSGPGKLTVLNKNVIIMSCYNLEQGERKKCFS